MNDYFNHHLIVKISHLFLQKVLFYATTMVCCAHNGALLKVEAYELT